jgi:hypothetical protein
MHHEHHVAYQQSNKSRSTLTLPPPLPGGLQPSGANPIPPSAPQPAQNPLSLASPAQASESEPTVETGPLLNAGITAKPKGA